MHDDGSLSRDSAKLQAGVCVECHADPRAQGSTGHSSYLASRKFRASSSPPSKPPSQMQDTTSHGRDEGLTRTLPVSVWADIITPAQSFTDVIQPTSAATTSSFSSTGLRVPSAWLEPLFIFWASWQQRESELRHWRELDLNKMPTHKESEPKRGSR